MRSALVIGAALAILLIAPSALARSIAIMPIAVEQLPPEQAARAGAAVTQLLRERGHEVLGPEEAARRVEAAHPGCLASGRLACRAQAALELGCDTLVSGSLTRDPSTGDVRLAVEAIETRTLHTIAESSHRTVGALDDELVALARAVATSLVDHLPARTRTAHLVCESEPSGAAVRINGVTVGLTPWQGDVPEGPALVLLEAPGFEPETRQLTLEAGEIQSVRVALTAPHEGPRLARRSHRLDALDYVLAGAAALGIVGGSVVAIASVVPGTQCDSAPPDRNGECQWVTEPGDLWPAAAAIAAGAAAGIVLSIRLLLGDTVPIRASGETVALEGHF